MEKTNTQSWLIVLLPKTIYQEVFKKIARETKVVKCSFFDLGDYKMLRFSENQEKITKISILLTTLEYSQIKDLKIYQIDELGLI